MLINFKALLPILLLSAGLCKAQKALTPGNIPFDTKLIKNGKYEMACYIMDGERQVQNSTFVYDVNLDKETFSIFTVLTATGTNDQWIDTSIADKATFKPIYRSSYSKNREMQLHYGKEVTGYHYDKKSRKKKVIKEPVNEAFLDSYLYPYVIGLLPLTSGYSASLPVYDYKPENTSNVKSTRIEEVKNNIYVSSLTGTHKVWQMSIYEPATDEKYEYYIDQETRRIWKVEVFAQGQHVLMVDQEIDFNPFKNTFDKAATLKMIKSGSGVISGQAFARDNQNEGALGGIAIVNINKKQYAQQGASIVLIPYTDFFKEWIKLNEASRKKGRSIPLPKDAADCIKVTPVFDDKGHFEFVNLMPGEYLIFAEFGYTHTSIKSEVTGYTDTYVNGLYQGTSEQRTSNAYNSNAAASIKKVVRIDKEGEKVEVKLKKTL